MRRLVCFGLVGMAMALSLVVSGVRAQEQAPPSAAAIVEHLKSEDEGPKAADRLAREPAATAVPALTQALSAEYPAEVRWRAARSLGAFGPAAGRAAGALIANLEDPNERVRAYSAYALGRMGGEQAQEAIPGLVERVTDENGVVRRAAIDALSALRPDRKILVPLMAKALEDAEPRIVMAAVRTLASEGKSVVPVLGEALQNEKAAYWAAVALEGLGPEAAPAVEPLRKLLHREEPEVRMQALMTLAAIGEAAQPAAPQIAEVLANDDLMGVRYAAAYALGAVSGGAQAEGALTEAANQEDPLLSMLAAWALAKANPKDEEIAAHATSRIVAGLRSENAAIQDAAIRILAETNLASDSTTPALDDALEQVLEDASPEIAAQAIHVIAAQGARAVPRVARALENEKLRPYAIRVLAQIGPEAAEAVPVLVKMLENADSETRREVQFTLAAIGPPSAPAVPKLIESLSSDNEEVKYSAIYALGRIGEQARDACPELMELMSSEEEFPQIAAVWAVARLDPGRPEVAAQGVPVLTKALQSERPAVRAEAAATLAEIGEPAKSALPALKQALNDSHPAVKEAARQAIERIEGKKKGEE